MWNIKPGIFPKRIENLSKRPEVGLYQPLDYKGGHRNVKRGKGEGKIDFGKGSFINHVDRAGGFRKNHVWPYRGTKTFCGDAVLHMNSKKATRIF